MRWSRLARWGWSSVWMLASAWAPATAQQLGSLSACRSRQVLLGVALADTVPVDSGVAFRVLSWDPDITLHGQKFLVERANPTVSSDTVILVQWNPTPDSPPYWPRGSTQWIRPGEEKVVYGVLRSPEHWTASLPTFDVRQRTFPLERDRGATEAATRGEVMTPEELFDFCSLQVDLDVVQRGAWSEGIEPLQWAQQNREAWRKYPAVDYLYAWARNIERSRVLSLPVDVSGTWSLTAILPSGRRLELFFRTSDRVSGDWGRVAEKTVVPPWEFRAEGYEVRTWIAQHVNDLPYVQGDSSVLPCRRFRSFPIAGLAQPPSDPSCLRAAWAWKVGFGTSANEPRPGVWEPELLLHLFSEDDELKALIEEWRASLSDRRNAGEDIPRRGEFLERGTGLEYHQQVFLPGGRVLQILAVRLSTETVREGGGIR